MDSAQPASKLNYINGVWVAGSTEVPNINPSDTSDIIGFYASGTAPDVDAAVAAARAAFPAWSRSSPQMRHDILKQVGDRLGAQADKVGQLLAREEGKTLAEAIGEVRRASQIFLFFAAEALRLVGDAQASVRADIDVMVEREPVGVIGLITPWNFPIAIPAWKLAPALAFGNCAIMKPADLTPGCAHILAQYLADAGLPAGVFNLVMGPGRVVGDAIVRHRNIDAISFTGSADTGAGIASTVTQARPIKKLQLEMGGKNPLVILDDADFNLAVETALNGAFFSTGQRCTASSRLIVTDGIHDRFVDALVARMRQLNIGHALHPDTQIGPVVDHRQLAIVQDYIAIGQAEGGHLKAGGQILKRETQGFFIEPALFVDVVPGMRIDREEIFGPVASVVRVADYDAALAMANDTEFGLSAGIVTQSLKYATHFRHHVEAGMVMVNLPTAGVDYHVPFGGRKASSYGSREQGRYAAEFYTTVKTSYIFAS